MFRLNRAFMALALAAGLLAGASSAVAQTPTQTPASPAKWVPIFRGLADIQYTKPASKRDKVDVVTTIIVKNTSPQALGRLTVEEFWYDKAGNPVTGGKDVCKKPLPPGESYTFTLRIPYDAKMNSNKYVFAHANGQVKPKLVAKF